MGLLKKIFIIILPLLFLAGCSQSFIKLKVAAGKNLYYSFAKSPEGNLFIHVNVGDSLKKLWDTDIHGGLTNTTAAVFNNYVFINDLSGWITCIDMKTGKIAGELKAQGAIFSTPILHGFKLIFPVAENNEDYSRLVYYDFSIARKINEIKILGKITGELIKTTGNIIFSTENGVVYNYDLDGNESWRYNTKSITHSSPALNKGIVVFGNSEGEIIGVNESTGKLIYRKKTGSPFYGSPSISGDIVFIGDDSGVLYALKLGTGEKIWQIQTSSKIISRPVFNGENVLVCNLSGQMYSMEKRTGKIEWERKLGGVLNTTPLLTDNFLIVPDLVGKLYFINVKNGDIEKEFKMKGRAKLSPMLAGNKLIVGYDYHTIAAYEIIK